MPSPFGAISSLTPKAGAGDQQVLVSVPSRGYLFLNFQDVRLNDLISISFPSPLEVISSLTYTSESVNVKSQVFPSPLGGISSSTMRRVYYEVLSKCFRPLSGVSLPQPSLPAGGWCWGRCFRPLSGVSLPQQEIAWRV